MQKQKLLFLILALTSIAGLSPLTNYGLANSPTTSRITQQKPYNLTLTLTQNPATSETITWETACPSKSQLQCQQDGATATALAKTIKLFATNYQVKTPTKQMLYFHSATLTGLLPGTKYLYRVGTGSTWSSPSTFTTEGNTSQFSFIIFGDSQSTGNYATWNNLLHAAIKASSEAKFLVNVGDLVDKGKVISEWNNWFLAGRDIFNRIPVMPIRGNHDTDKPLWLAYFKLPKNGPQGAQGLTYSFDYGPGHFVMLDNIEPNEKTNLVAQTDWLSKDLNSSRQPWKLVFFHKPFYANKAGRNDAYLKKAYQAIFDKYHVDLVINGHDHDIARTMPLFQDKAVSTPAEGTVYYDVGRSGTKYYQDVAKTKLDKFFYNPVDQPNYLLVTVSNNTLKLQAKKQDGTIIDNFVLSH